MSDEEQIRHRDILLDAPYLLEVITPALLNVGFVHADLHTDYWNEAAEIPNFETFTWSRKTIKNIDILDCEIKGIDWLIMGHTVMKEPYRKGNCVWIDTGSCFTYNLTLIDVDKDIESIQTDKCDPYHK